MAFVGVIGTGCWGKNIVRDIYNLDRLRAICDQDLNTLENLMVKYPEIEYSTADRDRLLCDPLITAVVIATPSLTHFKLAEEVLSAGKDCFIEKPMSSTVDEVKKLISLAESNSCILMVGHILQYHGAINKIYEMIKDGVLGNILYVTSNRLNLGKIRYGDNVLLDLAPHDISLILKIMGDLPESVSANGYSVFTDYDLATVILRFPGNRYAQINVNWLNPYKEHRLSIVGTEGMIVFDGNSIMYKDLHSDDIREQLMEYDDKKTALESECETFIDCCEKRKIPITDGYEGLRVMSVLESALCSLENSGQIQYFTKTYIDKTAIIDDGAVVGCGTKIWHFSHLMSTAIVGSNCMIGQNCFIAGKMGNGCKVQNNVSVYDGVIAGNNVFFGPSCVLTNDLTPRCIAPTNGKYVKTIIEDGVTIGANATILCGITLGRNCMIGAGAVVVKDVLANETVVGNPARVIS